jgi:hypothetical protein
MAKGGMGWEEKKCFCKLLLIFPRKYYFLCDFIRRNLDLCDVYLPSPGAV